jgi:ubiquinone/menaquinone biosynthesis C-methylase UbiE
MSFERLAPHYSWMERVLAGGELHKCRTAFLDQTRAARRALLLGEGHGRFLTELRRINPEAEIDCVEESPGMIRAARERLAREGLSDERIRFHAASVTNASVLETTARFDLVGTHFFLDCFPEAVLEPLVERIAGTLSPDGIWVLSDFQIPPGGWRALRARWVLRLAYLFFRVATRLPARHLAPPQPFLLRNGLRKEGRAEFNYRLLYAELWRKPGQ